MNKEISKWEDYSDECWCDFCQHRLLRKKSHNELVIVGDGYENYFLFDSFECAINHFKKGFLAEGSGTHTAKLIERLKAKLVKQVGWHISYTSIKILEKMVKEEDEGKSRRY